ncbi:MAG TPA: hypothetical protein VIJ75_00130 [Hanamia sp.]
MKSKILILLCTIVFIAQKQVCFAQDEVASGQCKLTIQKVGAPNDVQHYFFSSDSGHTIYLKPEKDGSIADFGFSGDFANNKGEVVSVMPDFIISPPGTGNFMIPPFGSSPKSFSHIAIVITGTIPVIADQSKACSGSITISKYPSIGGFMKGTFHTILTDNVNNYKVSGEFSIQRTQ